MTPEASAPWVRALRPDAHRRLLCFSYAGGGAAAFRTFNGAFPGTLDVCPVVLPGREHRMREPALDGIAAMVESMLPALRPALRRMPYALYGHSMGAWVAFELARALPRHRLPAPSHLFVGARRAPHLPARHPPLSDLDKDAFVREVQARYDAIPAALLAQPAILDLFLPTLRADFLALDRYRYVDEEPLGIPITAIHGSLDPIVDERAVRAWREHTTGPFALHTLPAGHFFINDDIDLLSGVLSGW